MKRFTAAVPTFTLCWLLGFFLPGADGRASAQSAPAESTASTETTERGGLADTVIAAESALRSGETQLAESLYRDALLEAWMFLGAGHAAEADWDAARDAFERATRQALELRRPAMALATVELRLGQVDSALARLRRLQGRRPGDREVGLLTARALDAAGRREEAIQELEELHAASPGDAEVAFALATGRLRAGDVDGASALFDQVAEAVPLAATHLLLGRTWRDLEHYDRARASFRRALEIDPELPRARFYLGTVHLFDLGRGALEPAVEDFFAELERSPDDPLNRLFLGLGLVELRRFEEALPHLERAAEFGPSRLDALLFAGRALLGLGRADEAAARLGEAVELAESRPAMADNQLASLHYQYALALRRTGRGDEARPYFDRAQAHLEDQNQDSRDRLRRYLNEAPTDPASADPASADTASADTASSEAGPQGEGAALATTVAVPTYGLEALPPAERAARRHAVADVVARANLNLGILQSRAERPDRAADHFRVARETASDPSLASQAGYSLGVALFRAGRHAEALEPLEAAWADRDGDEETLRRMLALTRLETERWAGAAELLADDPRRESDPTLQYAYGTALVRSGRSDEALPIFDSLAEAETLRPELAVLFGQAYAQEGDWPAAEESLRRALELDPGVAGARAALGEIYLRQGDLERAEEELRRELDRHPADLRSRFLLATVLDLLDRHAAAEGQVRAVLEATPDDADARYLLGKILFGGGDYEAAAAQLEAAARLAPDDATIRYQLAQSYQRLGRREAAREAFEVYRELKAASREPASDSRATAAPSPDEGGEGR